MIRLQTTQLSRYARGNSRHPDAARQIPKALVLACLLALAGCTGPFLDVNVFVVGERTSLEKQVLGNYQALSVDFESFGSVRGIDENGQVRVPPSVTESKQAAILAMQNRAYNRDDLSEFLTKGYAGESNKGTLTLFQESIASEPPARVQFIQAVVEEDNRDRETIIKRLMETTPGIRASDESRVRALFASLNRDLAPAQSRIQGEDGNWTVK